MSGSTVKAFEMLAYLSRADGAVSLARIARETGWDKATALRYLGSLAEAGAVEKRESGWVLGLALIRLASRVPVSENVAARARPVLERLARETGETVNLGSWSNGGAYYLAKADGGRNLRLRTSPGDKLPLHCTAVGKAILSALDPAYLEDFLQLAPYPKQSHATITEAEALREEVAKVRNLGYAMDREEFEPGLVCIATPVEIPAFGFLGAVSVSGPSVRMRDPFGSILDLLRRGARDIVDAVSIAQTQEVGED
ncbi:MAG TPA: IclR family transcriptional regulator [Magnetospirillaceae bacterium]|nr:IclR family transcriptional regulator [Magnetospirillaceae bacterium]